MAKYFKIERVVQAIDHLSHYRSEWIIVPLVFAVNDIGTTDYVSPSEKGRAGTDKFLEKYFSGALMGLVPKGNNSLRPKFQDVINQFAGDRVVHNAVKLWASHYSSRGYRDMQQIGLVSRDGSKYKVEEAFWGEWDRHLEGFHFEELLVWLYAFKPIKDEINSWNDLFVDFQETHLGTGKRFPEAYGRKFNVNNAVPWPGDFLEAKPTDEEYQRALMPSLFAQPAPAAKVVADANIETIVGEFDAALAKAGVAFGSNHSAFVRAFVVSILAKPFVILTGLSGSGKTQLAIRLGEWFGPNKSLIVPVRPDWASADPLFGYENLLDPEPNKSWIVPEALKFMLRAGSEPEIPFLLILDEMNLAHVERYFGDFLSGLESKSPVLPNLVEGEDGFWRLKDGAPNRVPLPENLIVIGTVNVDETTYMFSPKVLDRANTMEFRILAEDLSMTSAPSKPCEAGSAAVLKGLTQVCRDRAWASANPSKNAEAFANALKAIHQILAEGGFEFGHRTFNEALRFVALFEAAEGDWKDALDLQVYQKVLPRLHGSQRTVGATIRALGVFCLKINESAEKVIADSAKFNFDNKSVPELLQSYRKLIRMYQRLKSQQFTAFAE